MFNKRGISAVIATVLLILLTITAVAVLAGFIVPFVRNSLEGSTECFDYTDYFQFKERFEIGGETLRYNCYDNSGKHGAFVTASAARAAISSQIDGFELVFSKSSGGESVRINVPESSEISVLGEGSVSVPSPGEGFVYVYNSGGEIYDGNIEVYPRLKSGKLCERSDMIELRGCGANVNLQ